MSYKNIDIESFEDEKQAEKPVTLEERHALYQKLLASGIQYDIEGLTEDILILDALSPLTEEEFRKLEYYESIFKDCVVRLGRLDRDETYDRIKLELDKVGDNLHRLRLAIKD